MKILIIILAVISCVNAFIIYCVIVVGKQADERMNSLFMDKSEEKE